MSITEQGKKAAAFVLGCVTDPVTGKLSSSRIAGLGCVAIAGVIGIKHPTDGATTVAAFISGGAVAFLTRTKADQ